LTNIHPHAQKAAEASLCAHEQQRFWEFHDSLFGDQANLDVPALKQRAKTLGLNTVAFEACLDSGKHAGVIEKDRDEAVRVGVNSTPTIFVNGRLMRGVGSYAEIREVIEDELRRAAARK
jgi:protein-disulfide isomerase